MRTIILSNSHVWRDSTYPYKILHWEGSCCWCEQADRIKGSQKWQDVCFCGHMGTKRLQKLKLLLLVSFMHSISFWPLQNPSKKCCSCLTVCFEEFAVILCLVDDFDNPSHAISMCSHDSPSEYDILLGDVTTWLSFHYPSSSKRVYLFILHVCVCERESLCQWWRGFETCP